MSSSKGERGLESWCTLRASTRISARVGLRARVLPPRVELQPRVIHRASATMTSMSMGAVVHTVMGAGMRWASILDAMPQRLVGCGGPAASRPGSCARGSGFRGIVHGLWSRGRGGSAGSAGHRVDTMLVQRG